MKPDTSKGRLYAVSRGDYDKREKTKSAQIQFGIQTRRTKLVLEKGYSQQQAADHLGISLSALGSWVRAERQPSVTDLATKKNKLEFRGS